MNVVIPFLQREVSSSYYWFLIGLIGGVYISACAATFLVWIYG